MAYYTADALRDQIPALADDGKFPDATLTALVAEFEAIAERYRGVSFESRSAAGTCVLESPGSLVHFDKGRVTAIGTLIADGTTLTTVNYTWYRTGGYVDLGDTYAREVVVTCSFTHGYTTTPETIKHACREYVRFSALQEAGNTPRNATSQNAEGSTFTYKAPNWAAGEPTGLRVVDRLLNATPDERRPRFGNPTVLR